MKARLLRLDPERARIVRSAIDAAESHSILDRHIRELVAHALRGIPQEDRLARQTEVANRIIDLLAGDPVDDGVNDGLIETPPEQLQAIVPVTGLPNDDAGPVSPLVGLSASGLLVNARGEPGLAHALSHEIPSADSIDLLCAFVRWHGLRLLARELEAHRRSGRRLRVITTVFTGSTERKALDWLIARGAEVKVSYDTQSTRLHAKAWLFHRTTGFSTAYIGSSNLSKSALVDGVEWNVRLSQVETPDILEKFAATFDTYWESSEYESYDPVRDAARFDRAVAPQQGDSPEAPILFLDIEPWPHQREMLEKLAVERERHHRWKSLVVAATGTVVGRRLERRLAISARAWRGGRLPTVLGDGGNRGPQAHGPEVFRSPDGHGSGRPSPGVRERVLRRGDHRAPEPPEDGDEAGAIGFRHSLSVDNGTDLRALSLVERKQGCAPWRPSNPRTCCTSTTCQGTIRARV